MGDLESFLSALHDDSNVWWRQDQGDLLNLFLELAEDRDGWRGQVVTIRHQQVNALRKAQVAKDAAKALADDFAEQASKCEARANSEKGRLWWSAAANRRYLAAIQEASVWYRAATETLASTRASA